ncbi:hypothetical protein [Halomonas litopenaei]|uniref:hypothetical protein n=1 Tax=Halomonas litopenaei TaxID=2109328 RepID=UPI003FA130BA
MSGMFRLGNLIALGVGLLIATVNSSLALDSSDLEEVRDRATFINEVRSIFQSGDETLQLTIFEKIITDGDPVILPMTLELALNSQDARLKTTALRYLINSRELLLVDLIRPDNSSQAQEFIYHEWRELALQELKVAPATDEITGTFNSSKKRGQVIGQLTRGGVQLRLTDDYTVCSLRILQVVGVDLNGVLDCAMRLHDAAENAANANEAQLPIRVRLS